jgi:hypothetical protein
VDIAYVSPLVLSFHDFLVLFSPSSYVFFSYILPMYLKAPYTFNEILIIYHKSTPKLQYSFLHLAGTS